LLLSRRKAPDVEAQNVRDIDNRAVTEIRATQLPDAMSSLSESNIVGQFGATQVRAPEKTLLSKLRTFTRKCQLR
jgi:hypothetical protein